MADNKQIPSKLYEGWHLAITPHDASITEFEWNLLRFNAAFERFCLQVGSNSGLTNLTYQEMIILHVIRMPDKPKPTAIIARLLNRDDIPNIQYSLRKLLSLDLVSKKKEPASKIWTYRITDKGKKMAAKYAKLRSILLTEQTNRIENIDQKLHDTASFVSLLTGIYDEAARVSATYSDLDDSDDSAG